MLFSKLSDTPFDPSHRFATSWLLPPGLLFAFRALLSLYAFVTAIFNLGWRSTQHLGGAGQSFSFFTNLTYWGLAFYFAFSALHTGTYWLTGRPLLARWPPALQRLHSIFYSTITNFPFVVTSKSTPPSHSLPQTSKKKGERKKKRASHIRDPLPPTNTN